MRSIQMGGILVEEYEREIRKLRENFRGVQLLVDEQAHDPCLWRIMELTRYERALQEALKKLHFAIEEITQNKSLWMKN